MSIYANLADAIRAARGTDLYVIDGPDSNFAVVDRETAKELQFVDGDYDAFEPTNSYGFWSIEDAAAFDEI